MANFAMHCRQSGEWMMFHCFLAYVSQATDPGPFKNKNGCYPGSVSPEVHRPHIQKWIFRI
jgi:hypothetical protein